VRVASKASFPHDCEQFPSGLRIQILDSFDKGPSGFGSHRIPSGNYMVDGVDQPGVGYFARFAA
jgi:hypothetical protein